jgi:hypothetical protein
MPSSMTAAVRAIGRLFALGVALGISLPASVSVAQIASPAPAAVFAKAELQERRAWVFDEEQGEVRLDNEFSGARVNACERVAPLDYRIVSTRARGTRSACRARSNARSPCES